MKRRTFPRGSRGREAPWLKISKSQNLKTLKKLSTKSQQTRKEAYEFGRKQSEADR